MPNIIALTVESPDDILNAGAYGAGALIRLQTATTEAGAYADVTGTGSTPTTVVVTGTRAYTGFDPNGTVSSWYRTRFENVGATRLSDYSAAFQVAPEGSGLICSLWDVKQRLNVGVSGTADTADDELLLEIIGQVTSEIQNYTARRFVRSPASGTSTFYFDVAFTGKTLRVPQGIASATTLEVATQTQPETAGTFSTVTSTDWFLRPVTAERDFGWPATSIVISDLSGSWFYAGYNTVRLTGAIGWNTVPADVSAIAQKAVVRNFQARQSGQADLIGSSEFGSRLLRMLAPEERDQLTAYRVIQTG